MTSFEFIRVSNFLNGYFLSTMFAVELRRMRRSLMYTFIENNLVQQTEVFYLFTNIFGAPLKNDDVSFKLFS